MWGEITYPFLNFNGCTVEVWEWISYFTPNFMMDIIIYPCWAPVITNMLSMVPDINSLDLGRCACYFECVILQMTFRAFITKLPLNRCHRISVIINQYWFRWWLGTKQVAGHHRTTSQCSHGSPAMKFLDFFQTFSWPSPNFYWLFAARKYYILTFAGICMDHTDPQFFCNDHWVKNKYDLSFLCAIPTKLCHDLQNVQMS